MKAEDIIRNVKNDIQSGRIKESFSEQILDLFEKIDTFLKKEYPKFHKRESSNWEYYRIYGDGVCIAYRLPNGQQCEMYFSYRGLETGFAIDIFKPSGDTEWTLCTPDSENDTVFTIRKFTVYDTFNALKEYLKQK